MKLMMKDVLTRGELQKIFQEKMQISVRKAKNILEVLLETLKESLIEEEKSVKIFSFGTFLVHYKKERIGRNPRTKEEKIILPRKSISFRSSKVLKKKINGHDH